MNKKDKFREFLKEKKIPYKTIRKGVVRLNNEMDLKPYEQELRSKFKNIEFIWDKQ